ncbi:unnamed protein product [Prorocentrum cordatum]|uniref:Uncharacterized protein n=2 Tax=Prorocentrum cordatum TaxID=2364126 RepID=A0ABN9R4A2_9DINO|nr:unnamed protein product [Polarella glacialis]
MRSLGCAGRAPARQGRTRERDRQEPCLDGTSVANRMYVQSNSNSRWDDVHICPVMPDPARRHTRWTTRKSSGSRWQRRGQRRRRGMQRHTSLLPRARGAGADGPSGSASPLWPSWQLWTLEVARLRWKDLGSATYSFRGSGRSSSVTMNAMANVSFAKSIAEPELINTRGVYAKTRSMHTALITKLMMKRGRTVAQPMLMRPFLSYSTRFVSRAPSSGLPLSEITERCDSVHISALVLSMHIHQPQRS